MRRGFGGSGSIITQTGGTIAVNSDGGLSIIPATGKGCVFGPSGTAWDGASRIQTKGTGTTDATYGWTHYNSLGQFVTGFTDGGFCSIGRYSDTTGGVFVVQQLYVTSPTSGAFLGHYAYKSYNSGLNPHTQALLGARFVSVTASAMDSRLEWGFMNLKAETGAANNDQPNEYLYCDGGGLYGPMNIASGITAQPATNARPTLPAYGLTAVGGSARAQALATPAAPGSATPSPTGATSYTYWVVAVDRNGYKTLISNGLTVANGPATIGGGNQITVNFTNVAGAETFDVLRTTSSTKPTGTSSIKAGTVTVPRQSTDSAALSFVDTIAVGSLSSYTVPVRNTTSDLTVDGKTILGSLLNATTEAVGGAYVSTASVTVASNTTATLIGSGVGSLTIPANALTAGKTIRLTAQGYVTTTASPNLVTFIVKYGSTTVANTNNGTGLAPTASMSTPTPWFMTCDITTRTAGTSGTVFAEGVVLMSSSATAAFNSANVAGVILANGSTPGTASIDTTASQTVDFQVTDAGTGSTIVCTNFTMEVIDKG